MSMSHAFVVPAYGESPYLRDCLRSLAAQERPSDIVVATSTPFDGIAPLCDEVGARLVVHGPNRGIGPDWNAALAATQAPLVTVAHQDDLYHPRFSTAVLDANAHSPRSALYFCDAGEVTGDGQPRDGGTNARIKRLLVATAFAGRRSIGGAVSRRLLLGLGNPIVCPSVTINLGVAPGFRFREDLRTNMDWLAWLDLSQAGAVTYIDERLMDHRVHMTSETARCLDDGSRSKEDALVFERLWPRPVAALLGHLYRYSYQGYL
ncbi:MAG TPA: glycosyltransferase family 2 protein [Lysobacter sp.]